MGVWSDSEILDGMRSPEGRREAFRALHQQYGPRLLGYLVRMCRGDRDLAEDLLGRSLHKAYLGLAQAPSTIRSLRAWLYTIASRTALDHFEAAAAHAPLLRAEPLDEHFADLTPATQPEAGDDALDTAVEQVLMQLEAEDPRYRTLLEMEHVGVCGRGEIAEATGIPRKQLSQYLKRARERFIHHARAHPALAAREQRIPVGASK
ncbi:MAG: RNA polymerase sigma factor [Actinomycetota bacterium]